jgi:Holliday junction resolvase
MKKHVLFKRERKPTKFDALSVFAAWGQDESVAITHKDAVRRFALFLEESLKESLQSDTLLYGNRTQAMFEAVVANLGAVRLVKSEDSGDIYNADGTLEVPDTRVILANGQNLLVETKNCHREWDKPYRVKAAYLDGLVRYSKLVGGEFRIALFWSKQQRWTLISPSALKLDGKSLQISFVDAFAANDMGLLGDKLLGCAFPVVIRCLVEKRDGKERIRTDKHHYFIGDREITDPNQQRLLFFLMIWGSWNIEKSIVVEENDYKRIVDVTFMPMEEERNGQEASGTGCVMNEFLSTVLSRYWLQFTSNEDGKFKTMLPSREVWNTRLLELTEETPKFFAVATIVTKATSEVAEEPRGEAAP